MRLPAKPPGGFPVAYADPPWAFRTYSGAKVPQRASLPHYQVMSLDDMKAMPVAEVMAKDSALFMYVLDSMIPQAIELAAAWGFSRYIKVALLWEKEKMGMGFWSRNDCELCLMFARGKPGPRLSASVRQTIFAPPTKHSEKPIDTYERIEALLAGPYLELFARAEGPAYRDAGTRPGWTPWGLEAPGLANKVARLEDAMAHVARLLGNRFPSDVELLEQMMYPSEFPRMAEFIAGMGIKVPSSGVGQ